eukprot:NODE_10622_length_329_cov_59.132143_g9710_i0.p2 GENE.NODE_10622_length_329_cov_59.132143_g9710_i0~~NODE_10622_length_329_cov_59.132143_g9710_i0.p2  ORF type:complete len:82 (-),score=18.51 NODE_10622_length_329_cov_59.132143_g9710_i0:84-305(-)
MGVGFTIMIFFPCMLQWHSVRTVQRVWPYIRSPAWTPYYSPFSRLWCVAGVGAAGVILFSYGIYATIQRLAVG